MKKAYLVLVVLLVLGCSSGAEVVPTETSVSARQAVSTAAPGYISAYAGSGRRGYAYPDNELLAADLDSPSGLALCPDGALYVSDTGNNRVVKFAGGHMSVVAGGYLTTDGPYWALPYLNLIRNPRAETPVVTAGKIPSWTIASPATGWAEPTRNAQMPEPLDGEHYFSANAAATAEMYQEVNIAPYQDAIIAGVQQFTFTGFVRSFSESNPDGARIVVEYRTSTGAVISSYDSGEQANAGEWKFLSDTRVAPITTRKVRIRLISTRHTGSSADAFYDGLMFRALPSSATRTSAAAILGDNGPAADAMLAQPHGLACDTDGTLYIADSYNNRIRAIDPSGTIRTVVGNGTFGAPVNDFGSALDVGLKLPMGVAVNHGTGGTFGTWLKLVVSDFLAHRIRAVSTTGTLTPIVIGSESRCPTVAPGGDQGCVNYPMGVDLLGNTKSFPDVNVADRSDHILLRVEINPPPSGGGSGRPLTNGSGFSDVLGGWPNHPFGYTYRPVAVTSINADPGTQTVNSSVARGVLYADQPTYTESVPGFFIADLSNHAIRHATVDGLIQTVAGNGTIGDSGDSGPAISALFTAPSALVQSKDGTLYIADAETNRIRKISCVDVDRCKSDVAFSGDTCSLTPVTPPPVNDGNPCTDDACFWTTDVAHQPAQSGVCSDGNDCNGLEVCNHTVCTAGTAPPPGSSCSDNNPCNGAEVCSTNQTCKGTPPTIDDSNPCTVDACSVSGGVTNTKVADGTSCVSGDPCRNPGLCQNGSCTTTPVVPDTSNACVTETCDSTKGIVRAFKTGNCPGGTCSAGVCVQSGSFPASSGIDNTVPPSPGSIFAAIYNAGANGQTGVSLGTGPGQLNPDHSAHLFGTVALSVPSDSLTNVKVVVLNHPESGQTFVRSDGKFDMVANGGAPLVLRFTKEGYLPVDRSATPIWGAGAHIDHVVMVKLDAPMANPQTGSSSVALNTSSFQDVAASTITADPRGARTARLLFQPNTTATAISSTVPGGTTTTLSGAITVRATEFTVGDSAAALARMPAPLPPTVLYTYALEYTVDQAPNAASVEFAPPVFAYLENFIGTPTGYNVPDGYYDRDKTAWLPEPNGKALAVVGYDTNGTIIDITGDGAETQADTDAWIASTPANQRLTSGDRALIASRYPGGTAASPKRIWRVPLTHFSVHDFNHGGGVECVDGKCPEFASTMSAGDDAPKGGSCEQPGSIIGAEDQSLGEQLPVMGTPFALNYKSSYTLGYLPPRGVEVDYNPTSTTLTPKEFRVTLATSGGSWTAIKPAPPKNYIAWNGLDGAGRRINGSQLATIQATQVYSGSYKRTGLFGNTQDSDDVSQGFGGVEPGAAPDVLYTRTFTKTLSAWGADALGFGGWTLSPMHVYDPVSGTLYQGDGVQRKDVRERTLQLIGGNGTQTSAPNNTLAVNSGIPTSDHLPISAVASNGDVYLFVSEGFPNYDRTLRKIDAATGTIGDVLKLPKYDAGIAYVLGFAMAFSPDEKFLYVPTYAQILRIDMVAKTTAIYAGTGVKSHVDGPGAQATFRGIQGLAVAPDGSVYVADETMVRKIAPDGVRTVTTVAGSASAPVTKFFCPAGNGMSAKQLNLSGHLDTDFSVAVGPDGNLWIGSGYDLIRVDAAGRAWCHTEKPRDVNLSVAVGADNTVYYALQRSSPFELRTYNPDGSSTAIAGGASDPGQPADGARAAGAPLANVMSVSPGPDGSLYFINYDDVHSPASARIFRLSPPPKASVADCVFAIPSEDGSQKFCFDKDGRHLSTKNSRTERTLLSFLYDTNGLLKQIDDPVDINHTYISRTSTQVTIEGPFGQTTKITLDPTTHYATLIEDATHAPTYVSHDGNGLLTSLTDRNGNLHSFAYDSMGRLKKDANPVGFQSLERTATANGVPATGTVSANGYSVSDTSAAGAVRTFAVTVDANGLETRTVTMPDKSQNVSKRPVVGSTTTTFADRSVVTATSAIDPVSLKSYPDYTELTRPSQIKTTVRLDKSLVGDTVSINGSAPWSKAFDSNTKTYTVNTPAGRTSTITVDDHDRPIKVTAPGITPITYHYDHGRLDSASQGYRLTRFAYYAAGTSTPGYLQRIKVTDTTDSRIIGTLLEPDSAGRPLHSTTCKLDSSEAACVSAPVKTDLGWDSEGNLRSLTPPGRPTHYQTFTGTNLLQSYTPPVVPDVSDTTRSFTYNRDGALDFEQMPSGWRDYVVAPTTGQLVSNGDANFEYYSATETSAGSAPGRLSKANASAVSQKFAYDGPLLTSEQTTWLNVNASVSVASDVTAKLQRQTEGISVTASGGTSTTKATYDYADADGLLTCASLSTCSPGAANKLDLTRDPTTGALTGTTFGAVSDTYTWNTYGELASYSAQVGTDPTLLQGDVRSFGVQARRIGACD